VSAGWTPPPRLLRDITPGEVAGLRGHVVEVGDLEALGGGCGLLVECSRNDLKAQVKNLAFADVVVTLAEGAAT